MVNNSTNINQIITSQLNLLNTNKNTTYQWISTS